MYTHTNKLSLSLSHTHTHTTGHLEDGWAEASKRPEEDAILAVDCSPIQVRHAHWRRTQRRTPVHLVAVQLNDLGVLTDEELARHGHAAYEEIRMGFRSPDFMTIKKK
jgi:hypothetical protein